MNAYRFFLISLFAIVPAVSATPWNLPHPLSDQNLRAGFSVSAPWHLLKGDALNAKGTASLADPADPSSIRVEVNVGKLDYSAGIRPAANVLRKWLEANPLTPAKFSILKTTLNCDPATLADGASCSGTIDGRAEMKVGTYTLDVPVQMKRQRSDFILEGEKEIHWGEYGIGKPDHPIAYLHPEITFKFSAQFSTQK